MTMRALKEVPTLYDLLSVQEAADLLGVHRMTVYRMLEDGRLPLAARVGQSPAIERADVDRLHRTPTGRLLAHREAESA
jgi:excisionase family DNA binding protein